MDGLRDLRWAAGALLLGACSATQPVEPEDAGGTDAGSMHVARDGSTSPGTDAGPDGSPGLDAAAPTDAGPTPMGPVCGEGSDPALDQAVFEALTARAWLGPECGSGDPLPPTCRRVELRADGSYAWTEISDVPERSQSGAWNFRARDGTSGVVCLDDGSVIAFRLGDASMLFRGYVFEPGDPLSRTGPRDALPSISPSQLFYRLSEHAWRKTNRFDLAWTPDRFELRRDGRFSASYRDGACTHEGSWSLDHGDVAISGEATLTPESDPNTCDVRREPATGRLAASNDRPIVTDGILMLSTGATYRDAAVEAADSLFAFASYGRGLLVTGRFAQDFVAGAAVRVELTILNEGSTTHRLLVGGVAMQPLTADLSVDGPPLVLDERTYGVDLAPGAEHGVSVDLALPGAGLYQLQVTVESEDERQSWRNRGSYLLEL